MRLETEILRHALAATAARSSDDLLAALLEAIPDFVYFKDTERRFVRVSQPFADMFGRPLSEILGRRDEDLFPPEVAAETVPDDEAVLRGETIVDRIEGGALPTGERWVSTTKVPWRDADGRIVGLLGISRDITASKRRVDAMQREIQRAVRLETLGRLAGGVAHDFNNLLTVILGAADEIATALPEDDALHGLAELAREAAEQARGLTRQLLRFSRREPEPRQAVRIDHALTDLRDMLVRLLPDDIELALACRPVPSVAIDPVRLQQAVLNLALNARDAMQGGGRLSIDVSPALHGRQRGVALSVSDTGRGLDPEMQSLMFEPFYSTKPEGLGTGLGLTVVGQIVDEVGGTIEVQSAPGCGTMFRLWIPSTAGQHAHREPVGAQEAAAVGTALLVDDDPMVRRSVARMLRRMGYAVSECDGVEQAMEVAGQQPLDLVVTDVILRVGTGVDVGEGVRALQPEVPVLYISGFTDDVFQRRGLRPSTLELLLKPFTQQELQQRIEQLVSSTA